MIFDDFYFIGRNQAEMFGINFHSEWGKFGMIFFGNLNDNCFQIDVIVIVIYCLSILYTFKH